MNKLAAEKIAQQYYQIGQQLALESMGMTKEADAKSKLLKALGITGAAGAASLGTGASGEALMAALKSINPRGNFNPAKLKAIMTGAADDVAGYGDAIGGAYNSSAEALANLFKSAPEVIKSAPSYDDVLRHAANTSPLTPY